MKSRLAPDRMDLTQIGNRLLVCADVCQAPITCRADGFRRAGAIEEIRLIAYELKVRQGDQMALFAGETRLGG